MMKAIRFFTSLFFALFFTFLLPSLHAQVEVVLSVTNVPEGTVGVRGSIPPLSWEKTLWLDDSLEKGKFTAVIQLEMPANSRFLDYKFVSGKQETYELNNENNRVLLLEAPRVVSGVLAWNQPEFLNKEAIASISFSKSQLLEEFTLIRDAYRNLHPGLERYAPIDSFDLNLKRLEETLVDDMPLSAVYLAYARFLASIQCGHSFMNPYNQNALVRQVIYGQKDKVPFAFKAINGSFYVTTDGTPAGILPAGTEILAIQGQSVPVIMNTLIPCIRTDGDNTGQKVYRMEIHGADDWEAFDALFPLFFPPAAQGYFIKIRKPGLQTTEGLWVEPVTISTRSAMFQSRGLHLVEKNEDYWKFEEINAQTSRLTIGSFVTWNMELDWKKFLDASFQTLKDQGKKNLILDIRGNEGGDGDVPIELARHLVGKKYTASPIDVRYRYQQVQASLRPYLSTWENAYYDISGETEPLANGYFVPKQQEKALVFQPEKNAWKGNVYLLTDAGNSSATFYLAQYLKESGAATLVGQTTGGNLRGTNGGIILFLRLPYSGLEMDIPLKGYFPQGEKPNEGIRPDVQVQADPGQIVTGADPEMKAVYGLIRK